MRLLEGTDQFDSVQTLDRLGRRKDMKDDSADILFQSSLQDALVNSSGQIPAVPWDRLCTSVNWTDTSTLVYKTNTRNQLMR